MFSFILDFLSLSTRSGSAVPNMIQDSAAASGHFEPSERRDGPGTAHLPAVQCDQWSVANNWLCFCLMALGITTQDRSAFV